MGGTVWIEGRCLSNVVGSQFQVEGASLLPHNWLNSTNTVKDGKPEQASMRVYS